MIKRNHLTFLLKIHLIFFSLQFCVIQKFHSQVQNTENLPFPIQNNYDPTQTQKQRFDLGDPGNVKQTIVYDPITGKYIFKETYGKDNLNYRNPSMMTMEEYLDYQSKKSLQNNWKDKIDEQTKENKDVQIFSMRKLFSRNFFGSKFFKI